MKRVKQFFSDFKKFISRGNVIDMAVGVIIGGAFSAIMIFSLFWRKTSFKGAVSGIIVGGGTVILWLIFGANTGIYALLPGFILSSLTIIAVSLLMPDKEAEKIFDNAIKNL